MLIDYGTQPMTDPASGMTVTAHVEHDVTAEKLILSSPFGVQHCPREPGQVYDACALIHAGAPCGSGAQVSINAQGQDIVKDASGTVIGVFKP